MLTGEAEWRSAETEEGVVELLQSPPRVLLHPIVPELPDHQLPQGVVEVTWIPGAALRLSFRGQAIQIRILHEKLDRGIPGPAGRVDSDARARGTIADEAVL